MNFLHIVDGELYEKSSPRCQSTGYDYCTFKSSQLSGIMWPDCTVERAGRDATVEVPVTMRIIETKPSKAKLGIASDSLLGASSDNVRVMQKAPRLLTLGQAIPNTIATPSEARFYTIVIIVHPVIRTGKHHAAESRNLSWECVAVGSARLGTSSGSVLTVWRCAVIRTRIAVVGA